LPITQTATTETHSIQNPNRQIWDIAGPAIIANSSAPLVGLVDTWAIGHLPQASHLAAVGLGATVFSYIFWAFGFLRMSTTGLVAQAKGRDDQNGLMLVVLRSLALGILLAVTLIALQRMIGVLSIQLLNPPEATKGLFAAYFDLRIWSAPAVLMTYAITGYLIGVARAKTALVLQLVLNFSNAALNMLFVLGFNMGVEGIALGSLIAEWTACLLGIAIVFHAFAAAHPLRILREKTFWHIASFVALAKTNGFIFVRTLLLLTALSMVARQAGQLGAAELAASHVLMIFLMLISLGLDGFAYAVEALAGAAYGKGVRHDFILWVRLTTLWSAGTALVYCLVFYLWGNDIIATLTDIEGVRSAASGAMPYVVILPIVAVWCYQFDGIFIGVTAAPAMMATMLVSFAGYILIVGPLTEAAGLNGLWFAVAIFMGLRGLTQLIVFPRIIKMLK
jgi:MATE family multidrug resistance protein